MESEERARSLALIGVDRAEQARQAHTARLTVAAHAVTLADEAVKAAHATGEPVADLRRAALEARLALEGLKAETPALNAIVAQREVELRAAERELYQARRKLFATEATELAKNKLRPLLGELGETVEHLDAIDRDDASARYVLGHDLGVSSFDAEALYVAGVRPSELWEYLRPLPDLLRRMEQQERRRSTGPKA